MSHVSFGPFTFDCVSGELRSGEALVPLQPQPARVLALLMSRAGEVVTRRELRAAIWHDTWVNFDQGLNYCIRQIRAALDDDARVPRYVQTLPQRGYRFIGSVSESVPTPVAAPRRRPWQTNAAVAVVATTLGVALALEGAKEVAQELLPVEEAARVAAHLEPLHFARGTWTHHVAPAFRNVFTAESRRASE